MAINPSVNSSPKGRYKSIFIRLQKKDEKLLIIEGSGDLDFYSKYCKKDKIVIVDETKEYENGDPDYKGNTKTAREYILFLVDKHQKTVKKNPDVEYGKCYGIIDKDFNRIDTCKYSNLGNNLITTDGRDLETTLIMYDSKNIKNTFMKDFNTGSKGVSIMFKAIKNASQIGKIRALRYDKSKKLKIFINFKIREQESQGYYKYIDDKLNFNLNDYLKECSLKQEQIDKILKSIKAYNEPALFYCRGHDIFDFISGFYKKANKLSFKGQYNYLMIRDTYEKMLINVFNDTAFKKKSPMYDFIKNI